MTAEVFNAPLTPDIALAHAAATERFADFKTAAEDLRAQVDAVRPNLHQHPAFVDKGYFNETYALTADDGLYAMRLAKPSQGLAAQEKLADKSTALALAAGAVCAEQLVAHAPGILISEWMPGKRFDKLVPADHESVTDAQLLDLIMSMEKLDQCGIGIDLNTHNFFLDAIRGVGIVDLQTKHNYWGTRSHLLIPEVAYMLTKGFSIADPANAGNRLRALYADCDSSLKQLGRDPFELLGADVY